MDSPFAWVAIGSMLAMLENSSISGSNGSSSEAGRKNVHLCGKWIEQLDCDASYLAHNLARLDPSLSGPLTDSTALPPLYR